MAEKAEKRRAEAEERERMRVAIEQVRRGGGGCGEGWGLQGVGGLGGRMSATDEGCSREWRGPVWISWRRGSETNRERLLERGEGSGPPPEGV